MNAVLEEILRTGYTRSSNGDRVKVHSHISLEEGALLQEVIAEANPTVSLEVGMAYGVSTLFICDALQKTPQTRHIVIDPNQHEGPRGHSWNGIGLLNLKRAGYQDMIEFYNLPSYRALPQLEAQERKIDFAFIDGWHTFDFATVDFFYIDRMLRVGGIVVLDDANWPAIRKLCRYIVTNLSYSVFRCSEPVPPSKSSIKHMIANALRRCLGVSERVRAILKQLSTTDAKLGLNGSCIALKKESEDQRYGDFHAPF